MLCVRNFSAWDERHSSAARFTSNLRPELVWSRERWTGALEGTADLTSLPIHIHHYLSTTRAQLAIGERIAKMKADKPDEVWIEHLSFSFGYALPAEVVFGKQMAAPLDPVIENYYDPAIESVHSAVSGVKSLMYGYAECGFTPHW
jgi:hypothetical protein